MKSQLESPLKNTIWVNEDGYAKTVVKATDDGNLLIDGKEVDSIEEVKLVLNMIIKIMNL